MTKDTTLRLIYIHGFQGDHTSFQAFPTDLHQLLSSRLPSGVALESSLYPTYKSRRPVSEAAKNFVTWLSTQPPGPVILLAHSMGGLLAAEVAAGDSEPSKRVIGLVAFDVPLLGMHPHVIISGIGSLLPGEKNGRDKTEKEMNDGNIVTQVHGDDVENASGSAINAPAPSRVTSALSLKHSSSRSSPSFGSQVDDEWETMKATLRPRSDPSKSSLSPYDSSTPSARSSTPSLVSSITSTSSAYIISRIPPLPSPLTSKLERAAERIMKHTESPFVRWIRKHSDDPVSAMTRWIVEHFEFGICMFDPPGLRDRYKALEHWKGSWINFWTEVPSCGTDRDATVDREAQENEEKDSGGALPNNTADVSRLADNEEEASQTDARVHAKARRAAEKALRKERAKERKQGETRPARHFIVLPHARNVLTDSLHFGSRERWECFPIRNVEDEVEAHCGLFIQSQNPDYEKLVARVAEVVVGWTERDMNKDPF